MTEEGCCEEIHEAPYGSAGDDVFLILYTTQFGAKALLEYLDGCVVEEGGERV